MGQPLMSVRLKFKFIENHSFYDVPGAIRSTYPGVISSQTFICDFCCTAGWTRIVLADGSRGLAELRLSKSL